VTDFGIAKALGQSSKTATGVLKGKLGYMSPEQLRFEEPSRRSDLFALGVLLYEILAGKRLYQNAQGLDGPRRILTEPPPDIGDDRPEVPPGVVELLFELLAKEPSQRPATARDVSRRLENELAELALREGPADVTHHMEEVFAAKRRARNEELSRLLAETEAGAAPRSTTPARASRSRGSGGRLARRIGAAVLLVGGATAAALWAQSQRPNATDPAPEAARESVEPATAEVASAPPLAPPASSDPEPPATPPSLEPAASGPASKRAAGPAPRRPSSSTRPAAPARSATAPPAASERDFRRFE
jgi:serine/threonine-protein kinase